MRVKNAVALLVVILLVAGWAFLAINGAQVGKYDILPYGEGISLGLDLQGGVYVVYHASLPENSPENADFNQMLDGTITIMQARLTGQGYTEATVAQQGTDRIRVEIPAVRDPSEVLDIIGTPGHLEFIDPNGEVIMEGRNIRSAQANMLNDGSYVVAFELDSEGTSLFASATSNFIGEIISIELDGEVISSPTVNSAITSGSGYIEGDMTREDAETLAMLIMSGALPLDLEQLELRTISATLGVDAMSTSLTAGLFGVLAVMVFMIVVYRLPGLISCLALTIYLLIDLLLIAVLPGVQLTLPGVAGVILSIGMAVDANVIIFERIKEEIRAGKTVRASVESGFKRAFSAILDSNVTTLISAVVLGVAGAGSIRGFAITLGVGVVTSMFTAIVVTRFLLRRLIGLQIINKWLYGVSNASVEEHKARLSGFSVTKLFKPMCVFFALVFAAGIGFAVVNGGLNIGIDFSGGTMITYTMGGEFDVDDVAAEFAEQGITDVSVAKTGDAGVDDTAVVRMRDLGDPEREDQIRASVEAGLREKYPNAAADSTERVGAVAGRDLIVNAVTSLLISLVLMLIYIWFRFEIKSGVAAVAALAVSTASMVAVISILNVQINSPFIAAILTIVGYSINNTIVVFDRIRENNRTISTREMTRGALADLSVRESMGRTVNTTITTLVTLVLLFILGVSSIREFALPLIVGLVAGVLASIFIAPPIWGMWMDKEHQGTGLKKNRKRKAKKA